MPQSAIPAQRQGQRLAWADVAKGLSIILVVLHHLIGKHYDMIVAPEMAPLAQFWLSLTAALKPLRMPLFFLLSGFFAASAIRRPWRDVLGVRVVSPYYVYSVWLGIHALIFSFAQSLPMNRTLDAEELVLDLAYASTSLWFLYALVLYFFLAKALLAADARIVVVLAAAVAVVAPVLPIDEVNRVSVLHNFVYFVVGGYFPDIVRNLATSRRRRHKIRTLGMAYAALGGLLLWLDAAQGWMMLALSTVAVPLAIRCAVAVSAWPVLATAAARVGQRTLPIYVLHVPVLALLHQLVTSMRMPTPGPIASGLLAVYPLAATIVVTAGCLLIHSALTRCGLGWLFRRPQLRPGAAPTAGQLIHR